MANPFALLTSEGSSYDPKSTPPPFGHSLKKYFAFEEGYINLNSGSFGSQPLSVTADAVKHQLITEANPDKFYFGDYYPLLTESRQLVANFIGAKLDEVVLVPNATHGMNTILRNLPWKEGDILLGASTTYTGIAKTIRYISDQSDEQKAPTVYDVSLTFPMKHAEIVDAFRARIRELKQLHSDTEFIDIPFSKEKKGGNKFVAVIDSIVANPAALMPWQELVRICAEEGVWSVVDAAHSLGQEPSIDLSSARPDFWVSNAHKWMFAKRGCAALYVPERNQHLITSSVPTSHMYNEQGAIWRAGITLPSFVAQHEFTSTQDLTPYLSIKGALNFRKWLGGEEAIDAYCHKLAVEGGARLAEILGTKVLDESGELTLHMTNVLLPLPVSSPVYTRENVAAIDVMLREKLINEWHTHCAHFIHSGAWWVRCSAQVYNEISDFEHLGKALIQVCQEVESKFFGLKN